jgi:uroporphyrinogen decarboxylase
MAPRTLTSTHRTIADVFAGKAITMNKKERVRAALAQQPCDRIPASFWFHFPPAFHTGEAAVQAHLDYYHSTGVDFLKVMNEHRYQVDSAIHVAGDWQHIRPAPLSAPFYQGLLNELKQILESIGDEAHVIVTIHGVFASAFHATQSPEETFARANPVVSQLRADANAVLSGLDAVADSLARFAEECLAVGAHGIYYAALGGEQYRFSEEEFVRWIKPLDLRVLQAIEGKGELNILHICKDQVRLRLYADYPSHVVNWAVHEQNPGLAEGRAIFDRPILGGMDYRGVIVDGPVAEIEVAVHRAIGEFGAQGLLLGADCTLPTDTPLAHIRAAIEATGAVPVGRSS